MLYALNQTQCGELGGNVDDLRNPTASDHLQQDGWQRHFVIDLGSFRGKPQSLASATSNSACKTSVSTSPPPSSTWCMRGSPHALA